MEHGPKTPRQAVCGVAGSGRPPPPGPAGPGGLPPDAAPGARRFPPRPGLGRWFLLLVALAVLLAGQGCREGSTPAPVARDGLLDLSGWSPTKDGPLALDGQWEFYWDRLLRPEDFAAKATPPKPSGFLTLPGFWKGQVQDGQPLPGRGQATLRLRLAPGPGEGELALRLFSLPAACRLWVDGRLVAASGMPGSDADAETPRRSLILARFQGRTMPMELVLQVSNHMFRRGGVQNSLVLAAPEQLEQAHVRTWAWAMLFAGSLLVMAFYHFALYFLRQKDVSTLYFGLYCLSITALYCNIDASEWLIRLFVAEVDQGFIEKVSLLCYAVMAQILYRFYRSLYPVEFPTFIRHICDARSLVFMAIILSQPGFVVYSALQWYALTTFMLTTYYFIALAVCLRRGRDGALVLLIGCAILGATSLNDLYHEVFSVNVTNRLPIGLLAFVLSQALALAQRFSNAFRSVEDLSLALEANNAALQAEVDERIRLEQEIITVSEGERRRLSHELHDGLCQQLAAARLRCSILERRPIEAMGLEPEVSALAALLDTSVAQAYDLSRGLWPVEPVGGEVGLSLAELARHVGQSSGVAVDYYEDVPCAPCSNEHLVQLYRIAQEAVANAVKHGKPGRIAIALQCGPGRRLCLTVGDDGVGRGGVVRTAGGLGLRIMAYRARMIGATLAIADAAEGGTTVVCSLTCPAQTAGKEEADGVG